MLEIIFVFATVVFGFTLWRSVAVMAALASGRDVNSWSPTINGLALAYMIWYVFVGGWG